MNLNEVMNIQCGNGYVNNYFMKWDEYSNDLTWIFIWVLNENMKWGMTKVWSHDSQMNWYE